MTVFMTANVDLLDYTGDVAATLVAAKPRREGGCQDVKCPCGGRIQSDVKLSVDAKVAEGGPGITDIESQPYGKFNTSLALNIDPSATAAGVTGYVNPNGKKNYMLPSKDPKVDFLPYQPAGGFGATGNHNQPNARDADLKQYVVVKQETPTASRPATR